MIIEEFFFVGFMFLSAMVTGILAFLEARKSPIKEMYVFMGGFFSMAIGFLLILPATIMYEIGQPLDELGLGQHLHGVSFFFDMAALALLVYAFILPTFKLSYKTFFLQMFFMLVCASAAIINYFTITHYVSEFRLGVSYHPIGLFGFSFGANDMNTE